MGRKRTQEEQVLDLIDKKRIIRSSELKKLKIPRTALQRLLKEGWRQGRFSMDELHRTAGVCRVSKIMRPYIEALL